MHAAIRWTLLLTLISLGSGCKNGKSVSQETPVNTSNATVDYAGVELLFGMGGGVTGKYEEFLVQPTGPVLKKGYTAETMAPWKKLSRSQTDSLFARAMVLDLKQVHHNVPGDLTRYIEFRENDHYHRITWGDFRIPPPEKVNAFFEACWRQLQ